MDDLSRPTVDDAFQVRWDHYGDKAPFPSKERGNRWSKIGHLALWVMDQTGASAAAWADTVRLLDPATDPGGIARFVRWKRDHPRHAWRAASSVARGLNALAGFFAFAAVGPDAAACDRIARAMRHPDNRAKE